LLVYTNIDDAKENARGDETNARTKQDAAGYGKELAAYVNTATMKQTTKHNATNVAYRIIVVLSRNRNRRYVLNTREARIKAFCSTDKRSIS
jgi:hypothetical protein